MTYSCRTIIGREAETMVRIRPTLLNSRSCIFWIVLHTYQGHQQQQWTRTRISPHGYNPNTFSLPSNLSPCATGNLSEWDAGTGCSQRFYIIGHVHGDTEVNRFKIRDFEIIRKQITPSKWNLWRDSLQLFQVVNCETKDLELWRYRGMPIGSGISLAKAILLQTPSDRTLCWWPRLFHSTSPGNANSLHSIRQTSGTLSGLVVPCFKMCWTSFDHRLRNYFNSSRRTKVVPLFRFATQYDRGSSDSTFSSILLVTIRSLRVSDFARAE